MADNSIQTARLLMDGKKAGLALDAQDLGSHAHDLIFLDFRKPIAKKASFEKRFPPIVQICWALVAHFFLCISIALCMTLLDGYPAFDNADGKPMELGTKRSMFRLRVSEVTTIISAALVAVRITSSSWTAITLWRCAFILMKDQRRNHGIKLSQLSYMLDWCLPFSRPRSRDGWVVVVVLLLLFPQSLIGPLLTGAVGWSTSPVMMEWKMMLPFDFIPVVLGKRNNRNDYLRLKLGQSRRHEPMTAASFGNPMWVPASVTLNPQIAIRRRSQPICRQRVVYHGARIGVNSLAYNSTLPCIWIESIRWKSPPDEIEAMVTNLRAPLNFTFLKSPLLDTAVPGSVMLFDPHLSFDNITLDPFGDFPLPQTFNRSLSLLLIVKDGNDYRPGNYYSPHTLHTLENATIFGSIQNILSPKSIMSTNTSLNENRGFAYAIVEVTAGVVKFDKSLFIASDVLEGLEPHTLSRADFIPNRWATAAMTLLSDVVPLLAVSNVSEIPTWNNLDGYVKTLIAQAYFSSWSYMQSFENTTFSLKVHEAEPVLLATVSRGRVWSWFIINMLVPISGVVWYFGAHWPHRKERHVILHGPMAALLADVQVVGDGVDGEDGIVKAVQFNHETSHL